MFWQILENSISVKQSKNNHVYNQFPKRQTYMIFCHNCQSRTPQHPHELKCRLCGCEAVETISHPQQHPSIPPFSFQSEDISMPQMLFGIDRRRSAIFPSQLLSFEMRMSQLFDMPQQTTIIFINGGQNQEEINPVSKEIMNKFERVNTLNNECSICQQGQGQGLKLTCGHEFHRQCINPWFQQKNSCPCCRKTF